MRCVNFLEEEYNGNVKFSLINFWMVLLILLLFLIILQVDFFIKFSLNLLFILLWFLMILNDFLIFFLMYEIVFIFIIFVILLLGYRYERLLAGFLIMFYSFLFSSPVLIILILLDHTFLIKSWLCYSVILNYFFIGSFIVKFPIFGFHYWLPVAHVEASTIGSILLAGILLKIGSLGLFYIVNYLCFFVKFHWLLLGVLVVILIILSLRDLKIIIAYSSIAHITLVFYVINLGWEIGIKGAIVIIFYHGFLSPLIFWLVGLLSWWKTRSLIVVKNIIFSYLFILFIFFLSIINIGFPPFIGFLSEILIFKRIVIYNYVLWLIVFSVLFRCYYNIYLFWAFNRVQGLIFKVNINNLDVWIFLCLSVFLNFF